MSKQPEITGTRHGREVCTYCDTDKPSILRDPECGYKHAPSTPDAWEEGFTDGLAAGTDAQQRFTAAVAAMRGLLANGAMDSPAVIAVDAILYADALLKELARGEGK